MSDSSKRNNSAFDLLVQRVLAEHRTPRLRPVIEKEILHYEILNVLDKHRLLDALVFQGGTCLRMVYGSQRLSEDLDFAAGNNFNAQSFSEIKTVLENEVGLRFGLEVVVKEPKLGGQAQRNVQVKSWTISVVTVPHRTDIPRQRIKIEIASVDALTSELRSLQRNYADLPAGHGALLLQCESLEEIMADKLVSLVNAKNLRYRDLWDLPWLSQQGARVNSAFIQKKCAAYGVTDYRDRVDQFLGVLHEAVFEGSFKTQMERFLPNEVLERTFERENFLGYVEQENRRLLSAAIDSQVHKQNLKFEL